MTGRVTQLRCLLRIPLDLIDFNPRNIRDDHGDGLDELAESIRVHGVIEPLVAAPHPRTPGRFMLIAGHRRFEAAHLAGLDEIQVVVRGDLTRAGDTIATMLVENLHRRDLTPLEQARALRSLMDIEKITLDQAAGRIGKSPSWASRTMLLLDLTPDTQERVARREITATAAIRAVEQALPRTARAADPGPQLNRSHRLAGAASVRCTALPHDGRRLLGSTACAECWEATIRADERHRIDNAPAPPKPSPPPVQVRPLDQVAIERAMRGDPVHLTADERREAVRRLTDRGNSAHDIAERLRIQQRSVVRIRQQLLREVS